MVLSPSELLNKPYGCGRKRCGLSVNFSLSSSCSQSIGCSERNSSSFSSILETTASALDLDIRSFSARIACLKYHLGSSSDCGAEFEASDSSSGTTEGTDDGTDDSTDQRTVLFYDIQALVDSGAHCFCDFSDCLFEP